MDVCSECLEECDAVWDDGKDLLPDLAHGGKEAWLQVSQPQWLSDCCGAPIIEK